MDKPEKFQIISVNQENLEQYGAPCFLNPKHDAHCVKKLWIQEQLAENLKIKHLIMTGEKKPVGFIEYIAGENAWRAVDAPNYLFIHCICISPNKYKEQGYGSKLIQDCITDAKKQGKSGVATITSEGSFIAGKDLFLKNNFKEIATSDRFELLVYQLSPGKVPQFRDNHPILTSLQGLHLCYSDQCPWVSRSIPEFEGFLKEHAIPYTLHKYITAKDAQNAPSIYATFTLVFNGRILVDHYISLSRFQNILSQEKIITSKTSSKISPKSKIPKKGTQKKEKASKKD
jgi:hypothetical protein